MKLLQRTTTIVFLLILTLVFVAERSIVFAAVAYDLANDNSYHLRYDGAAAGDYFGPEAGMTIADVNHNGKNDIIVSASYASFNGSASGSVYIFTDDLIEQDLAAIGTPGAKQVDLLDPTNYSLRIDGDAANQYLDWNSSVKAADITDNGRNDLLIGNTWALQNGQARAGSLFVLSDTLIDQLLANAASNPLNKNIALSDVNNYSLRYDGDGVNTSFSQADILVDDVTSDGKKDLIVGQSAGTILGRANAGAVYIFSNQKIATALANAASNPLNKHVTLSDTSLYDLRYVGAQASAYLSSGGMAIGDLNNDGQPDLVSHASNADGTTTYKGALYLFDHALITTQLSAAASSGIKDVDLATTSNYTLKYLGNGAENIGFGAITIDDVTGDQKADIIAGACCSDFSGRLNAGSLYVIPQAFITESHASTTVDLADTTTYLVRVEGIATNDYLANGLGKGLMTGDISGDGLSDIFIASAYENTSYNGKSLSGSLFITNGTRIKNLTGRGNSFLINDPNIYDIRYDGASVNDFLTIGSIGAIGDLNNDGALDFITTAYSDYNGRSGSGSVWAVLSFPHTVQLDAVPASTLLTAFNITGTVDAPLSLTPITEVEYQVTSGGAPVAGSWAACTADDGTFDSTNENYTCALSGLTIGSHTVYVRAKDSNNIYTAAAGYASAAFIVTAPPASPSPIPSPLPSPDPSVTPSPNPSPSVLPTPTPPASPIIVPVHDDNLSLQLPQNLVCTENTQPGFTFARSPEVAQNISKYRIKLDSRVFIDNIAPLPPTDGDKRIREDSEKFIRYEGNTIFVYSKMDRDKLAQKSYRWQVESIDRNGKSQETGQMVLRVNSAQALRSLSSFPLSVNQVGQKSKLTINSPAEGGLYTCKQVETTICLTDTTPTISGVSLGGTEVTLNLEKLVQSSSLSKEKRRETFVKTTTRTNSSSQYGFTVTQNMPKGEYYLRVSATTLQGDYAEVPELKLIVGSSGLCKGITPRGGVSTLQSSIKPLSSPLVKFGQVQGASDSPEGITETAGPAIPHDEQNNQKLEKAADKNSNGEMRYIPVFALLSLMGLSLLFFFLTRKKKK